MTLTILEKILSISMKEKFGIRKEGRMNYQKTNKSRVSWE